MPSTNAFINKTRNARWAAEHRNCRTVRPWLAGAPPFGTSLPGVSMTMRFDPHPRWPIELRNTRGLHGMISAICPYPHTTRPLWALRPWQNGWAIHWYVPFGDSCAGRAIPAELYGRPITATFGQAVRLRSPVVVTRGRQRVRIDTITPVARASLGKSCPETRPSASSLHAACLDYAHRLAPSAMWWQWVKDRVAVGDVDVHTQPVRVDLGAKYGVIPAWDGHVVVECNAVARWLLESAARIGGFGSRAAFGFGWIRTTDVG